MVSCIKRYQEVTAMRLKKIQAHFEAVRQPYQYWEEDDCGSITFLHRGLSYHIW